MDNDDESDPAVARVRDELARLGTDEASAPDVPAGVTARIGAALRAVDAPAHSIRRPRLGRLRVLGLVVGVGAALAGVIVGASMLARQQTAPPPATGPTAESITVPGPSRDIPLSEPQILALLSTAPDYGSLANPQRRASCLDGLGYPAMTPVLGARPVDMYGRPGVLMLLPGETDNSVAALVVEPNCSAAHTGLLADTVVIRP